MSSGTKKVIRLCPICLHDEAEVLHHQKFATPDGYPLPDRFDVVACTACGMIYADTSATQADYSRYYAELSNYESPGGSGATPAWDLARLGAAAKAMRQAVERAGLAVANARVCDIGCANGGLLQALHGEGFRHLTGVDPSAQCVANTMAAGFEAVVGDLSNVEARLHAPAFDVVVLTAVLEHVMDAGGAVAALSRLCNSTGMVFLEVPDAAAYEHFLHAPFQDFNTEHINHFSRASLRNQEHIGGSHVAES